MKAELLLKRRVILGKSVFAELVLWRVPRLVPGSLHNFKYRLALVSDGICVMRYDNEAGKGDHCHHGTTELSYDFKDVDKLLKDFEHDVQRWLAENSHSKGRQPE